MPFEIVYSETCPSSKDSLIYVKPKDLGKIVVVNSSLKQPKPKLFALKNAVKEILLPHGYPESVSSDYASYQMWDTLQAFCSTISNILTTQAILKGVGVGDEIATPTSAAITWILKDGTGMIAKIMFAWLGGTRFDSDCKKWRLFADLINDVAMCIEILILPYFSSYSLQILCVTSSMKAVVGVAGGATRAAVTQHQAVVENSADVSAKDGSQETCVNLVASLFGILILSSFEESSCSLWLIFCLMTFLHLYSNYKAVKSLNLNTINPERFAIIVNIFFISRNVLPSMEVNKMESVLPGIGFNDKRLCGYEIKLGCSLNKLVTNNLKAEEFKYISNLFKNDQFIVFVSIENKTIYVALQEHCSEGEVIKAYFSACLYGISFSYILNHPLKIFIIDENSLDENSPISLLKRNLEKYRKLNLKTVPMDALLSIHEMATKEGIKFITTIKEKEWSMASHHLGVSYWRGSWGSNLKNLSE